MRVLLADDEARVRFALRVLLQQQPGVELVGEATRAGELLATLARVAADVVLLDWELPDTTGPELLGAIHSERPHLPVIAMSGNLEARNETLAAGADTFVCKTDPPDRVLSALAGCRHIREQNLTCLAF